MGTYAAMMTGPSTGAISTIQVFGDRAESVLETIFKPSGKEKAIFKTGKILLGRIVNGTKTIDQVTLGCEQSNCLAIHCHGNPLIVEMVMELLSENGVKLITAEQLHTKILTCQKNLNTIQIEAKSAIANAKTIEGTQIISNQINDGLNKKAGGWLADINLEKIKREANQILENSQIAKLIIEGCTAIIIGPPNSGKSTLLNCLSGRAKAIVTDIKGTTRDYVTAQSQISPLVLELIDTAGLGEDFAIEAGGIEALALEKTTAVLKNADLVLLVLDAGKSVAQLDNSLLEKIADKKILTILNKSDLPAKLTVKELPKNLSNTVSISAKKESDIETLAEKIRQICEVADFDLTQPVAINDRQQQLLEQLTGAKTKNTAIGIITELLNGNFSV